MASLPVSSLIWCDEDGHRKYEDYVDFNEWLEGDEGLATRESLKLAGWARPSKVLFAGDKEQYEAQFERYRVERRAEWLSKSYLEDLAGDAHWSDRNVTRFDHLCDRIERGDVVPFVGAGLSVPGGFPSWKDHLRDQWRTAGLDPATVGALLAAGRYEEVVDQIERARSRDTFVQELRDSFDRNGTIPDSLYLLSELFTDTLITTNYDRLIEQAFDVGGGKSVEVLTPKTILNAPDSSKTTLLKLHGDILKPAGCIMSRNQYDEAYGDAAIDLSRPLAQVLDYHFRNSNLLFLGCNLNEDRTIRVFEAIKANAVEEAADLPQHFAIEQCPADQQGIPDRNDYLLRLGITPIWFEADRFEFVEGLLRLARNEMRYRRR